MKVIKTKTWASTGLAAVATAGLLTGAAWVNADQTPRQRPLANLTPQQQAAIDSAHHLSSAFRTVADELLPSVVAIENRPAVAASWNSSGKTRPSNDGMRRSNPFQGTPFEDMFKGHDFQSPNMAPGRRMPAPRGGIGSGVIIDEAGIILTNNHVVAGGGEVTVRIHDGREFVATDVWTDPKTDLAVVKVDATDLVAATLGDSENVAIGDWVIALGQPFGLESTVTAGIISAKHRGIGITARENFLQTDAAINPGNSGGPLVNLHGEVVGINTAIHSRSGGNEGIGFAVPSNLARWVGDQLVNSGTVKRAYLGVGIQPVTQDLATELAVKPRGGVVVTDVYPDTPAAKSGLESGDVIVRFGNKLVATPQALQLAVERSPIGDELTMEVVRDGKAMKLSYEAEEQPGNFGVQSDNEETQSGKRMEGLGLEIAPLSGDVAKQLGMEGTDGVVITSVREGSSAAEAGLAPGFVIREVNRQKITSVGEFEKVMAEHREDDSAEGILLLVRSEKGSRFVVVKS
ncbi:MAG: Do family serine endopeptidase [Rubripirellula sp.]